MSLGTTWLTPPVDGRAETPSREQAGFTLIELLVAMSIGAIILVSAFTLLLITQTNLQRSSAQIHIDQSARTAFERIMNELHSGCVVPEHTPIKGWKLEGETTPIESSEDTISFVSEIGEQSSLPEERLHKLTYSPSKHTLTEEIYRSTEGLGAEKWNTEEPLRKFVLAKNVYQTEAVNSEHKLETLPVFRYYRYYLPNEAGENPHPGILESEPLPEAKEAPGLSETEASEVAKVTVSFSVALSPEESSHITQVQKAALIDSAVYRLTPASEVASERNEPCS